MILFKQKNAFPFAFPLYSVIPFSRDLSALRPGFKPGLIHMIYSSNNGGQAINAYLSVSRCRFILVCLNMTDKNNAQKIGLQRNNDFSY